ncbi:MAG: putative hybrid sensor histidine kinase [Nitrospira sp. OLB3]|nr:MAG: putative hybrid sensor histidine kinase [Nitrospira sp. OLB3]
MSASQPSPHKDLSTTLSPPPPSPAARESQLELQRLTLLYQALPAALLAGGGCAIALVLVDWEIVPHNALLGWLAYQASLAAGRYRLTRAFTASKPTTNDLASWNRLFLAGTSLAGLGWGMTAIFLFPSSSPAHQLFLAFILGGITAGASSSLAPRFDAFLSFAVPTLLPLLIRLLTLGTGQAVAMAVCTLLFSLLMVYTAFRMSSTVLELLRLKDHNAHLVDQLSSQLQEGAQMELFLNVKTEHHRFVMEYAQDLIYRTDRSGRFTFINPAVVRILGYHETELLGHRSLDLVHPDHRRATEHFYIRQFLRKIPSTYYEFPMVTRNGPVIWVGQNVQLLQREGEVTGFQAVLRDISARKQAEEALRISQDRYRALFESSPEMSLTVDATGILLAVNSTTSLELGYGPEELIGKPVTLIVHPEDHATLQRHFADCLHHPGDILRWEFRKIRKDGTVLWAREAARAVRNQEGRYDLVIACENVTERKGIEDALTQTRQLLESIVEHIPHMVFLKQADGLRFVQINRAGEQLLGLKRETLLGKNDFDFFPREQAEHFTQRDREVLAGHSLLDIPAEPIQTKDLGLRWLHTKKLPLYDQAGIPRYLLGISEDITERKQREEIERLRLDTLQTQQAVLHQLAEHPAIHTGHPADAFAVITEDAARTCAVERAGIWLFDETRSALVLHDVYEAKTGQHTRGRTLSVGQYPAYLRALEHEPYSLAPQDARTDPRTSELAPSYLQTLGIVALLGAPIRRHGRVIGVLSLEHIGTTRVWSTEERTFAASLAAIATLTLEATDRRRAQESLEQHLRERSTELRRTTAHLETIIEESPLAIIELDHVGHVTTWNAAAAAMFGWTKEEVLGRELPYVPAGQEEASEALWQSVMSGRAPRNLELRRLRKDGTLVDVNMWGSLLHGHRNQTLGSIGFFIDVTEHKLLEDQLRQAHKMEGIGRLAGGVAHDFNNLLTVINGCAALLLDQVRHEDPLHDSLAEILSAGQRAAALTKQLLAFSRRQVLALEVFDLNEALVSMAAMIERLIGEDIALSKDLVAVPCTIRADRGQIDQVVLNLAVNAKDAMPQGGRLTMSTRIVASNPDTSGLYPTLPPGAYVLLRMQDSGQGMDRDTLSHIFEPFFTTKEEGKGTGLGLAMVYGIVKQTQGFIFADSLPGDGATFDLYFPLVEAPLPTAPLATVSRAQRCTETILLVEDQEAVRQLLAHVLTDYGYRLLQASNGQDALHLAAAVNEPIQHPGYRRGHAAHDRSGCGRTPAAAMAAPAGVVHVGVCRRERAADLSQRTGNRLHPKAVPPCRTGREAARSPRPHQVMHATCGAVPAINRARSGGRSRSRRTGRTAPGGLGNSTWSDERCDRCRTVPRPPNIVRRHRCRGRAPGRNRPSAGRWANILLAS